MEHRGGTASLSYQPIQNYGIIGDLHSVALVGVDGSIDWLCFPHLNSPSLFAAILDAHKGGSFLIAPSGSPDLYKTKQFYWPDTNVLVTRFLSPDGVGEMVDYMPIGKPPGGHGHHQLIRQVRAVRGRVSFRAVCQPAFNYARDPHEVEITHEGAIFRSPSLSVGLATDCPLRVDHGAAIADFTLDEGQSTAFVLGELEPGEDPIRSVTPDEADALFRATVAYWRGWLSQCTYTGRWREIVYRSALALKLLTFEPTGAMVAAPTCSLPEHLGGRRNWDYRYTWIRDAAFTVYAFLRIGFTEEATAFMGWLEARAHEQGHEGPLQLMYGIEGDHHLEEEVLHHLEGYQGSAPVRIGNAAHRQLQMDVYGELMDAIYLYNKHAAPISYELWTYLRRLATWVCDHWQEPDKGIWEVRGAPQHFVYSKVMCWVALDRALRLADKRSFPADRERWLAERDRIYEDIMARGWNPRKNAFVQSYGSTTLDAANLIMPLVFFLAPNDPRMLSTLDAINRPPAQGGLVSNGLVYRYDWEATQDGLRSREGTFSMCTFWLVEALTRAGRVDPPRLDEARLLFEQMLGHANHVGLFAEQVGPSGEALGNFPQAFTHLALISAAFNLDRALGSRRP